MKIAFLLKGFPVLSETFILNQITGLIDLGHQVEIFAQSNPREISTHPEVETYRLMDRVRYMPAIPKNKTLCRLKALAWLAFHFLRKPLRTIKSLRILYNSPEPFAYPNFFSLLAFPSNAFDILQCHYGTVGRIGAYIKQLQPALKLVTMFHGFDTRLGIEKGPQLYRHLFDWGDCFLTISDYNRKHLIEFDADPEKMIHHPVGIDVSQFSDHWINAPCPPQTTIIITVARFVEEKGLPFALKAIARLMKKYPNRPLQYHLIGDGPMKENLESLVNNLGLNQVINFLGAQNHRQVIHHLQKAHLFLLPSLAEALPVVLMEAHAAALPIIATSVGSTNQIVSDGESGFLVPPGDIDALEEKLKFLIDHPQLWPQMGRHGRNLVEKNFDIKKLNKKLVQLYEKLKDSPK